MKIAKKVLKWIVLSFVLVLLISYWVFTGFTAPKSNKEVLSILKKGIVTPLITEEKFKNFTYRKVTIKKHDSLPNIVFVHGTIGSSTDFSNYMTDSLLQIKANMISYDRIGYNYKDENNVQESIAFERDMLADLLQNLNLKKTILVGYSYGGPIALATKKPLKKIILCAPSVYSKVEPMPWLLYFYRWKLTRWLVPKIWKQASKEKISHPKDLQNFEHNWKSTPNTVLSIHGKADWIVPFANSEFLKKQFSTNQFKLISIKDAGHGLIWTDFKQIKKELIKSLEE